jgi:glycosyltransferase involved in cell wall biosynthesis
MEYPFVYLSTSVTSVSKPDADYLKARYKRDVIYIPNGANDCIHFNLEKAHEKLNEVGLAAGDYLMFAAGRIDPIKGCHLVLEALNRIGNPCKIAIIGDLQQVPTYSDYLREIANKKQVVFVPLISERELLFGMIKLARLFIFPSTHETMSMMLLESASLQTPIICSDIPENKIVMDENVLYFHSEDSVDLAEKIEWALSHPREMSDLGKNAGTWVQDHLTWGPIIKQYERIYEACIK